MHYKDEEQWKTYCDSALGTLADDQSERAVNRELQALCGFAQLDAVPAEDREEVEVLLAQELQARRLLGNEVYQKCKSYGEKISLYIAALDMMRENREKLPERCTFAEFRSLQQKAVSLGPGIERETVQEHF